jgi:DNA polymerase II small subunit
MVNKEILTFCLERGILLDNNLLELFQGLDLETSKIVIQSLKEISNKRIINKDLLYSQQDFLLEKIKNRINELEYRKIIQILNLRDNLNKKIQEELNKKQIEQDNCQNSEFNKKENLKKELNEPINVLNKEIKISFSYPSFLKKLEVCDFVNYFKSRLYEIKTVLQENLHLKNLISINKLSLTKQSFSVIGLVYSKSITKNKNIIFEIEDLTGKIKVLIPQSNEKLYSIAEDITLDSVLAFSGFGNKEVLFANEIFFPDCFLNERKRLNKEENLAFIGDIHYGSKLFLEKSFLKFIDYLNDSEDKEAKKIRYLFIVGDLIAGVGNYPSQEKDLKVKDIEEQFKGLASLLSKIRRDITIIISPGNHDGVRLMEPQPQLNEEYAWPLYNLENVILTGNPSYITLYENKDFSGFNLLLYHGFSFPFYANSVPSLIKQDSLNAPTKIMAYLLKNRHLAPTHSSVQYFPSNEDFLIIKKIPDIFVSGHTHKCEISYYNNILLISVASWESKTSYQEKMGNKPDFCKVPVLNLKSRSIKLLDFEEESEHGELKLNNPL